MLHTNTVVVRIFIKVASVEARHPGIKITHRLAVVDNFKGIHDAVGKDPAHLVQSLELMGTRSPTGCAVFENCFRLLQKNQDQTEWKKYETLHDVRLKNKGKFGMDTRTVWFVTETKEEQDKLLLKYPGRILLCDRSYIRDTHNEEAIKDTTNLHEVCSLATTVPTSRQPVWPVKVSNLPCNWPHCIIDPTNDVCVHSPWRKSRMDHMIEAVEDEELIEYSLSTLMKLNVPELRRRLRVKHLIANGNKGDLAKRLAEALVEAANTLHLNTPTLPPTLPNQVAPPSNIN